MRDRTGYRTTSSASAYHVHHTCDCDDTVQDTGDEYGADTGDYDGHVTVFAQVSGEPYRSAVDLTPDEAHAFARELVRLAHVAAKDDEGGTMRRT